jgi:predicted esterase
VLRNFISPIVIPVVVGSNPISHPILLLALFLVSSIGTVAQAAPGLTAGALNEFKVELPGDLRTMAGRGAVSPVTHALVTIAVPANFDAARAWPVLVVSATSDPGSQSSRRLLRAFKDAALASGWAVVAADPSEPVAFEQDNVPMRIALNTAALAVLEQQWAGAGAAPLAFAGFSGGAKFAGWLAAAFASRGRRVIGVYLTGVNENTLVDAAMQFNVVNAAFKRTPVFVLAGLQDRIATPADQQGVAADLNRAGFRNVRIEHFAGAHDVDPAPLRTALEWFGELAAPVAASK